MVFQTVFTEKTSGWLHPFPFESGFGAADYSESG
jgi:hypothetical protein